MICLEIRTNTLNDIRRRIEKIRCRVNNQEEIFLFNILCGLLHQSELTVDQLNHMEPDVNIRQKMLGELRSETILAQNVTSGSYLFHGKATEVCVKEFYKEKKCLHCKSIKDMKF